MQPSEFFSAFFMTRYARLVVNLYLNYYVKFKTKLLQLQARCSGAVGPAAVRRLYSGC
jgi:hypothetical protein